MLAWFLQTNVNNTLEFIEEIGEHEEDIELQESIKMGSIVSFVSSIEEAAKASQKKEDAKTARNMFDVKTAQTIHEIDAGEAIANAIEKLEE